MSNRIHKLSAEARVKCQWCLSDNAPKEWDSVTFSECKTREMKRSYKSIINIGSWYDTFYKCPNCGMWSKGSQLLVLDGNGNIKRGLGGEPIFKVSNKN